MATVKWKTKKELQKLVADEKWSEFAECLCRCFMSVPISSPIRKRHCEVFKSLTRKQRAALEKAK